MTIANDKPGKKYLSAMAAILGASVGMHAAIAEGRGIEASEAESGASVAADASPLSVAQDINVRRESFPSGRSVNRRPSNQLKFGRQPSTQFKLDTKRKTAPVGKLRPSTVNPPAANVFQPQPAKIYKIPPPPAPFVPSPLPNKAGPRFKSKK